MNIDKVQRLAELTASLTETLMTAAICADEIRVILRAELDGQAASRRGPTPPARSAAASRRPLVDNSTLSVRWAGKCYSLRNTILFRLAERLSRCPNQYISAGQLLHDVWDGGVKSPDTIRSAVRHLRDRLSQAGMSDLAAAIRGTGGRYGLILDGTT